MSNPPKNGSPMHAGMSDQNHKIQQSTSIISNNGHDINLRGGHAEHPQIDALTPASDTGVNNDNLFEIPDNWQYKKPIIMGNITSGLHWLSITLFCELLEGLKIYYELFAEIFGELAELKHGLTGFTKSMTGSHGFKIAYEPMTLSKSGINYISFIIPGAACECIEPKIINDFIDTCEAKEIKIRCTRLDYKFDNCNFSPYQFRWMIKNKIIMHQFQIDKLRVILNDENNEIGIQGKCSIYTGSMESNRLICCYDTHGFTRLEVRNKGERANMIFEQLGNIGIEHSDILFMSHLQDYINIDYSLWTEFVGDTKRAYMKIDRKPDPTLDELESSFIKQWAAGFTVLLAIKGENWINKVLEIGEKSMMKVPKYAILLHRYGIWNVGLSDGRDI